MSERLVVEHVCETCPRWERGGYQLMGDDYGVCAVSRVVDGTPDYPHPAIIGVGTWGDSYVCTHKAHTCPNWGCPAITPREV